MPLLKISRISSRRGFTEVSNSRMAIALLAVIAVFLTSVGMTLTVFSYGVDTVDQSPDTTIIEEED